MSAPVKVLVERLPHAQDLPLPRYESDGAAGLDLTAAITEPITLAPGARAIVPTGLRLCLPLGYEAQVRPRSGLAAKHGLTIPNSPGTIDSDYRGEVKVILYLSGSAPLVIERGMRIAQLVVAPVVQIAWDEQASLPTSARGARGFGSTGHAPAKSKGHAPQKNKREKA